ncbi:MAG: CSLREA domain-containing protein [Planctomycetota bacterium]
MRLLFCLLLSAAFINTTAHAATIFESGTLGQTGLTVQDIFDGVTGGTNVQPSIFTGVRFELTEPVRTTEVGGHFVASSPGTFFGAIVALDDEDDFPDSEDLSTPDVLGVTELAFPVESEQVFGDLSLLLQPGWYALAFGSGLFGTSGQGAALRNNPDIGSPTYIGLQSRPGRFNLSDLSDAILFEDHHFVVKGIVVPEPGGAGLFASLACWLLKRPRPQRSTPQHGRRLRLEACEERRALATLTVDSTLDVVDPNDGVTTLREAVEAAEGNFEPDEILFDLDEVVDGTTIQLT